MAASRGLFRKGLGLCLVFALWPVAQAAASGSMVTGGVTSQPIGHYEFCKRLPVECMIRPKDVGPENMTRALLAKLDSVNIAVNKAVKPLNDVEIYGREEYWAYPDKGVGDCEDYALEKRRRLVRSGLSLANLLVTVVRKPDGEGHAVLTVRTNTGDYVLDNLSDVVKLWSKTRYRFLKRQASFDTGRWVTLREDNNLLVGAVDQ